MAVKCLAQNVIREKNQALNFLRLGSRIDAVASRLETAISACYSFYLTSKVMLMLNTFFML